MLFRSGLMGAKTNGVNNSKGLDRRNWLINTYFFVADLLRTYFRIKEGIQQERYYAGLVSECMSGCPLSPGQSKDTRAEMTKRNWEYVSFPMIGIFTSDNA